MKLFGAILGFAFLMYWLRVGVTAVRIWWDD